MKTSGDNESTREPSRGDPPLERLRTLFASRPLWMNALWLLCLYMAFVATPLDLLRTPVARDQEVWFGFLLQGWWAKLSEPLHWAIYAAGAWGFHRMRPWMWPWAALYCAQVAVGILVWNLRDDRGRGWVGGLPLFAGGMALAIALWRARDRFQETSHG